MEERGLVGVEARDANGEGLGRISEVITDEESGEVTHVMVGRGEEQDEVPISSITLDPDADFATVAAGPSDEEPGDHAGDEEAGAEPEGYARYAPAEALPGEEDLGHEGQLVSEPDSPREAESEKDVDREDWGDEESTPVDSGYPRTDAYIDPQTGEATEGYPDATDTRSLEEAVEVILEDTGLRAGSISDGVVELVGNASDTGELDRVGASIMTLEEVFEVDTAGVEVG